MVNQKSTTTTNRLEQPYAMSYLLRLWQAGEQWQASLDEPATGQRIGFGNIEQLFVYLMNAVEETTKTPFVQEETRPRLPAATASERR